VQNNNIYLLEYIYAIFIFCVKYFVFIIWNMSFFFNVNMYNFIIYFSALSVEITEENVESDDDHSSDPDYEPSFNITIRYIM